MSRFVIQASWDDVPHLSKKQKDDLRAAYPAYQRDARTKGIPQLGAGAIYPIPESEVLCDPFKIPRHWPRAYALDVGWNRTAALWGAYEREQQCWWLYAEHYRGQAEPSVHAAAIRGRGSWIAGVIDPAARGRSQADGKALMQSYRELGLSLTIADNALEAGIFDCYELLATSRIRVVRTLLNWLAEYRLYRRDKKGAIVSGDDHLMDTMRYLIRSGQSVMRTEPQGDFEERMAERGRGRSKVGGY